MVAEQVRRAATVEFDDLRGFLDLVEADGELRRFNRVDWHLEIGAINEALAQRRGAMCLFDEIRDYPAGYRVSSNPFTSYRRTARILRLPIELEGRRPAQRLPPEDPQHHAHPASHAPHRSGLRERDHGRRTSTSSSSRLRSGTSSTAGASWGPGTATVTRDPEDGWVNLGTYRNQIMAPNLLGILANPGKHGRIHIDKHHEQGKPAPVVRLGGS